MVPKEEFIEVLWDGRAVSDSALTRAISHARRALKSPAVEHPIRTVYGTGYQLNSRAEVMELYEPTSQSTSAPHSFVGRKVELERFSAVLAHLEAGAGGIHLVAGEPGIGKSALVEELIELATARRIATRLGRCFESGGAASFWPWVQVLRQEIDDRGYPSESEIGRTASARITQMIGDPLTG